MTQLNQDKRDTSFVLSQAAGHRSLDNIIVLAGTTLKAGEVYALDGAGKAVPLPDDGTDAAEGIALNSITAAAGADGSVAGFVRDGEVIADQLIWPAGISQINQDAAVAQLAANGIVIRAGASAFTP